MHFGRYGRDSEDMRIVEMYLGYPEFVRGYGLGSFDALDCEDRDAGGVCEVFNSLRGSRVARRQHRGARAAVRAVPAGSRLRAGAG